MDLELPAHLTPRDRDLLTVLAERNLSTHGDNLLGLVLSGSVGRDLRTDHSDLDVYVVLGTLGGRRTERSSDVDEIPVTLAELESPGVFGTEDWFHRWSFAWAPVLLDRAGGRVGTACRRQATLTVGEIDDVLFDADRLDGYVNYAYRALKNDRDGRALECRLDAAESVPWLLDTVFALHGRVRPYMKYLPWELRTHPLDGWDAGRTLDLLARTLDGDPSAVRELFALVERDAAAHPRAAAMIADWGAEPGLLRSAS